MNQRFGYRLAAWLVAVLLALVVADIANAQTKGAATGGTPPTGTAPPTNTGTTTGVTPPAGGATTGADGSMLSAIDRMVILMGSINDVVTLTAALGAQDVSEFEMVLFVLVLYEDRIATAEADAA